MEMPCLYVLAFCKKNAGRFSNSALFQMSKTFNIVQKDGKGLLRINEVFHLSRMAETFQKTKY